MIETVESGTKLALPSECPSCGTLMGEGSFHAASDKEYGAEAMTEWFDTTREETIRCSACSHLVYRKLVKAREFME